MIPKTAKDASQGYLSLALMYIALVLSIPVLVGLETIDELLIFAKLSAPIFAQLLAFAGVNGFLAITVWRIAQARSPIRMAVVVVATGLAVLTGFNAARGLGVWYQGHLPGFAAPMPLLGFALFCFYALQAVGVIRIVRNAQHGTV